MAVQRAGQRRRFEHRHAVLGAQLADARGDQLGALGHHLGRAHAAVLVGQRHGIVGRVSDDHVGGRHLAHHPPPRHRLLLGADAPLDVRITLGLLVLLAQVFLAHAQLLGMAPQLVGHVDADHQHQRQHAPRAGQRRQVQGIGERLRQRLAHQRHHLAHVPGDELHGHPADQQRLGKRLRQLG
ncbi:hypothetical protein D3C81_1428230 [compost metagenome]